MYENAVFFKGSYVVHSTNALVLGEKNKIKHPYELLNSTPKRRFLQQCTTNLSDIVIGNTN